MSRKKLILYSRQLVVCLIPPLHHPLFSRQCFAENTDGPGLACRIIGSRDPVSNPFRLLSMVISWIIVTSMSAIDTEPTEGTFPHKVSSQETRYLDENVGWHFKTFYKFTFILL